MVMTAKKEAVAAGSVAPIPSHRDDVPTVKGFCGVDFSIQCPTCHTDMVPEHSHYRCLECGYRDSCCM
jgi:hypothetical protein